MTTHSSTTPATRGALSPDEAAEYLATTTPTLAKWRYLGEGPPFCRIRSKVVYRVEALDAYLRDNEVGTRG